MTTPKEIAEARLASVSVGKAETHPYGSIAVEPASPKPKPTERRSAPVRNPAFRDHEGLRALQKELNSRRSPRKNK